MFLFFDIIYQLTTVALSGKVTLLRHYRLSLRMHKGKT